MILTRRSDLGCRMTAAPVSSTLRSTIIKERSRNPSTQKIPFERLLLEHCEKIVAGGSYEGLTVQIELKCEGTCPVTHEKAVLRVTDELLSNSIEHGFYSRQTGRVFVHVSSRATNCVQVSVSDDGWGFDDGPIIPGNGFYLLQQIGDLRLGAAAAGPFVAKTAITVVIPLRAVPSALLGRPLVRPDILAAVRGRFPQSRGGGVG
jgi:glucose-6-phosphate-specific signal transduction histidine kinase